MISIIVCCYDPKRIQLVQRLIDSFKIQTMSCEMILVVEKSEELANMIHGYTYALSNVQVLFEPDPIGLAKARNLGISKASGDLIAFIDDDAYISPNYSEELTVFMRAHGCNGVTGRIIPDWEKPCKFPQSLYWVIGCDDTKEFRAESFGHGANMAFRREKIKDFTDSFTAGAETKKGLVGDDVDLQLRVGKIVYDPNLIAFHFVPKSKTSLSYIAHYSFWQGRSERRFNRLYGRKSREKKMSETVKGLFREFGLKSLTAMSCAALGYLTK